MRWLALVLLGVAFGCGAMAAVDRDDPRPAVRVVETCYVPPFSIELIEDFPPVMHYSMGEVCADARERRYAALLRAERKAERAAAGRWRVRNPWDVSARARGR